MIFGGILRRKKNYMKSFYRYFKSLQENGVIDFVIFFLAKFWLKVKNEKFKVKNRKKKFEISFDMIDY